MKLAIIFVALLLPLSAAQAQMNSIANPGTPPPAAQESAAPPSKAEQKAARKQGKRPRDTPSNKTVQELYDACVARHQAKGRSGRKMSDNCAKIAQARGR